ncbi:MAG: phosphopyruvate hydratase [Lentisphaeria bacterium]|nr:phosphopyruvate hydratase [Lentisphaeria bacterium]
MSEITAVLAREIVDSRGNPALEAEVRLASGVVGVASVPAGRSTGVKEACELRDGDMRRFHGAGLLKAVGIIEERIAPELTGIDGCDQMEIDRMLITLDGTPNKDKLGANSTLAVSLASARAGAEELEIPLYRHLGGFHAHVLPIPMFNLLNGGVHADAGCAFQELMVRPVSAESFVDAMEMGMEIFASLKALLAERHLPTTVGDEGGFLPPFPGNVEKNLEFLLTAADRAGLNPGSDVTLALDCAASGFFVDGRYDYRKFEGADAPVLDAAGQIAFLTKLADEFPLDSIEDGMAENDWDGWRDLTSALEDRCQLVGDDLFCTNLEYLRQGVDTGAANAILLKPNQIGTLTETFDTADFARRCGYLPIVSHRSGETEDTFIADLAVALNAGQIKAGSLSRSERTAKYNRLLRIEEELGHLAVYGL